MLLQNGTFSGTSHRKLFHSCRLAQMVLCINDTAYLKGVRWAVMTIALGRCLTIFMSGYCFEVDDIFFIVMKLLEMKPHLKVSFLPIVCKTGSECFRSYCLCFPCSQKFPSHYHIIKHATNFTKTLNNCW